MTHGDEKHSPPLGVKYKVYSPSGPCTLLALPHTPPMWRTKEAFRALMRMQLESRGDEFSLSHLNYCCH